MNGINLAALLRLTRGRFRSAASSVGFFNRSHCIRLTTRENGSQKYRSK
jgi:hypothetical protein